MTLNFMTRWFGRGADRIVKGQDALLSALQEQASDGSVEGPPPGWTATHQHRKGGLYRVLGRGIIEADGSSAVIYQDAQGQVWIRPSQTFEDGRFEPL